MIDPGVDLAHARERETVDHDGMDDAVAQQVEQCCHVSLELVGARRSACGDAVEHGVTAAEQSAQHVVPLDDQLSN